MKNKPKKTVWPIYTALAVWLICVGVFPMYRLGGILPAWVIFVAALVFFTRISRKSQAKKNPPPAPEKPAEPKKSYGPEIDAILEENCKGQVELGRLYASIKDTVVKKQIRDIMEISDKIAQDAIADPSDVPQIRKFQNYYLPTTIKLLNAYDRMGQQGVEGENITGTMRSIEQMLDTAVKAYRKQLDGLFANQALDIETDINVMNTMLKRQGLSSDMQDTIDKQAK